MPTFKITLAYDGTDFVGWQRQPDGVSIQALIEDSLHELDQRDVTVVGAGRTDAGVHALAQIAAFSLDRTIAPDTLVRAVNARLPATVRVLSAELVDPAFHPRFDAKAKTYRYRIWNADVLSPFERRYAWHIVDALDVEAMGAAARLLDGRHDFAAFQGTGSDTVTTERELLSSLVLRQAQEERHVPLAASRSAQEERGVPLSVSRSNREPLITYEVTGDGFLRHMVRNIVGSLVEVGRGRVSPEWIGEVLASRDRRKAGRTAPAAGLFLVGVNYV